MEKPSVPKTLSDSANNFLLIVWLAYERDVLYEPYSICITGQYYLARVSEVEWIDDAPQAATRYGY